MKKTYYIKNVKPRNPLLVSIVFYLIADKIQLEWLWGITWFLIAILWVAFIIQTSKSEEIDLFDTKEDNEPQSRKEAKSRFQQKMQEMMEEAKKQH